MIMVFQLHIYLLTYCSFLSCVFKETVPSHSVYVLFSSNFLLSLESFDLILATGTYVTGNWSFKRHGFIFQWIHAPYA